MIIRVTKCEECPFSYQIGGGETVCSKGGDPNERWVEDKIPDNCPLIKEEITIKLEE